MEFVVIISFAAILFKMIACRKILEFSSPVWLFSNNNLLKGCSASWTNQRRVGNTLVYCASLLRRGFCFLKNRGKDGKAEKRERRKKGKGGKSAREREKRRKPLPDFCRNMAKVVDIRPHTAWVQAKLQLDRNPLIQGNGTSEVV